MFLKPDMIARGTLNVPAILRYKGRVNLILGVTIWAGQAHLQDLEQNRIRGIGAATGML